MHESKKRASNRGGSNEQAFTSVNGLICTRIATKQTHLSWLMRAPLERRSAAAARYRRTLALICGSAHSILSAGILTHYQQPP